MRFSIYKRNIGLARKLQTAEKGTARYGETQFADLSQTEFQQVGQMGPNF